MTSLLKTTDEERAALEQRITQMIGIVPSDRTGKRRRTNPKADSQKQDSGAIPPGFRLPKKSVGSLFAN
jgi:hypothetical protein